MKVLGVEIRFGTVGPLTVLFEAKVVPVELAYPDALCVGGRDIYPRVSITVHTSEGDVTLEGRLPQTWHRDRLDFDYVDCLKAAEELRCRVEAM